MVPELRERHMFSWLSIDIVKSCVKGIPVHLILVILAEVANGWIQLQSQLGLNHD